MMVLAVGATGARAAVVSQPAPVRVAIVDDDDVLRTALLETINRVEGMQVIGAVASLSEAMRLCRERPDVFLIDLSLPDGSGFELISHLRAKLGDCKALVISVFGDVQNVVHAIELGADGYLLKGAPLTQTAAAIRTVLDGGAPLSPGVAGHILRRVRASAPRPVQQPKLSLTPREVATLEGLAKGLSVKELAKTLEISPHTVGDHVKAIYRKLQVNSRGEAIFEAAQNGLIRMHE